MGQSENSIYDHQTQALANQRTVYDHQTQALANQRTVYDHQTQALANQSTESYDPFIDQLYQVTAYFEPANALELWRQHGHGQVTRDSVWMVREANHIW